MIKQKSKFKLSVYQFLVIGYLVLILFGSILLILPFATKSGEKTTYINALFTSVSATCVTGLVPYDTATHWSLFGQIVILLLIQIGGLGFMTIVSILFDILGRNMNLYERKALMQTAGTATLTGIRPLIRRILIGTFSAETIGACLLSIRFIPDFGAGKGIYYAIWHSVSAFCNAGFDLMGGTFGGGKFVSLTHYAADPLVSLVIMALIVTGGLGFCVWSDVIGSKFNPKKFNLNTKVVLIANTSLLFLSTMLYFLFDLKNPNLSSYNGGEHFLIAMFNAVTPRTAGFNAVDFSALSESSRFLTIVLMFIGGSSASTAGGIKIGTFSVILMGMIPLFSGKKDINIGNRRLDSSIVNKAMALAAACMMIVLLSTLVISAIEWKNGVTFEAALFESVSALGTVGLSLSLTPTLSIASKCILMVLMYAGRVGILTLVLSLGTRKKTPTIKKPLDTMLIG